jgi:uracil-DNA glycosylase
LWNALPFHPHRPGRPWSNRTPTRAELRIGDPFLVHIIRLFHIQTVVAVGNKAARSLRHNGISGPKVRHPAHGGKAAFMDGIRALLEAA